MKDLISIILSNIAYIIAAFVSLREYISNGFIFGSLIAIPIIITIFYFLYFKTQILEKLSSSILFRFILFGISYIFLVIFLISVNYIDNKEILSICLLYAFLNVSILMISIFIQKSTRNDIGIVASCIPIKFENNSELNNNIEIYLIENPNHENKWMLPGGHVKLGDEKISDVLKEKAKTEAGLEISILGLPEESNNPTKWKTISGLHHFTYSLKLDEKVMCNKKDGHKKHIDFMFVGKVESILNKFSYKRISIKLNINSDNINAKNIRRKIDDALENYEKKDVSEDIPKRIEIALNAYKKYR